MVRRSAPLDKFVFDLVIARLALEINMGRLGVADNLGGSSCKRAVGVTGGGWVEPGPASGLRRIHIDHNSTVYLAKLGLASIAARLGWCGVVFGIVRCGARTGWHLGGCWPDRFGLVLAVGADIVAVLMAAMIALVAVVAVVVMVGRRAVGEFVRRGARRNRVDR